VFRICFPVPEIQNFNRIHYQVLATPSDLHTYPRNLELYWQSSPDTNCIFRHRLNMYGFRDEQWSVNKKKGKKRIMILGDSFVEGAMAPQDETIPIGFDQAAGEDRYEVLNAGMIGIGFNAYIKFLVDAVPIFQPDEVFLVIFSNDIPFIEAYKQRQPIEPVKNSFWTPRLLALMAHLRNDDPISFRWSKRVLPFLFPYPTDGNPWTKNYETMDKMVEPHIKEAMLKGTYNYYRTAWVLKEEVFLQRSFDLSDRFQFLKEYRAQYNTNLQVVYIPSRTQITNYYYPFDKESCTQCPPSLDLTGDTFQLHQRLLQEQCGALDIPFYDLTDVVKEHEDRGHHLYWDYDDHMRGKSYLMLGKTLYQRWAASGNG